MFCNGTIHVLRSPDEHDGLGGGCCELPAGLPLPSGGTRSPPTILPLASRNTTAVRRLDSARQLADRSVYRTASAEAADENQRRVEGVFAELAASTPENVSYIVLRLADDSFVQRRGRVPVDVRVSRGRLHLPGCVDADRAGGVTSCAIAVGSILDHLSHERNRPRSRRNQYRPVGHYRGVVRVRRLR